MNPVYDFSSDAPTPVLLVDAHHLLRIGVATLIDAEPDLWVAAQAAKAGDIRGLCECYGPELVVVDLGALGPDPAKAIAGIRTSAGNPRVIVLAHRRIEEEMMQAMRAGAQGYFFKSGSPHELLQCLRSVREGKTSMPCPAEREAPAMTGPSDLSPRELHILARLASGHSNRRIGVAFGISESTVRSGFKRIFDKLGVNNRCSAVAAAVQRGLIAL
ncbi:MAG: two component transcriptional regulator, LuxR family [Variovorax sp.]|jgi:DNA-binding NarL/FixJ family response regulator|nr:two component transcriptional regulator, LuxR family [Variovorax sp.]